MGLAQACPSNYYLKFCYTYQNTVATNVVQCNHGVAILVKVWSDITVPADGYVLCKHCFSSIVYGAHIVYIRITPYCKP